MVFFKFLILNFFFFEGVLGSISLSSWLKILLILKLFLVEVLIYWIGILFEWYNDINFVICFLLIFCMCKFFLFLIKIIGILFLFCSEIILFSILYSFWNVNLLLSENISIILVVLWIVICFIVGNWKFLV